MLRHGPVALQESKWVTGQVETLSHYLPGTSAPVIETELGK